ncbi:MAG: hypothetical protein K0S34_997 [Bacillales bacterium]|jgi:tetratricopeptide (TPR) repeat protein|nr:hypothetical protein [Bacillales bacterium]
MDRSLKEKKLSAIKHLLNIERYEDAEIHIKDILVQNPFDPDGLYFMAVVHFSRLEYELARNTCQEALEHGYDEATCHHFIATIYKYEKDYNNAEQFYLTALEMEPQNGEILASYGYLMFITGFEKKALALLENAYQLEPHSARVNQYVLDYYFAKSDSEKQLVFLKSAMESASDDVQKLINIATYHALRDEDKEAREYYRQAFLIDPKNHSLLDLLSDIDERVHILYLPLRLMNKIGGPAVVWGVFMLSFLILNLTKQYVILFPLISLYLLFVVYSWIAPLLYKLFVKERV